MARTLVVLMCLCGWSTPVWAQLVDHTSIALFEQLPPEAVQAAQQQRVLFVDRSVGYNIDDGLTCLTYPYASAPTRCKRYLHVVPVYNNQPEAWIGSYSRPNWHYYAWPGSGIPPELPCGMPANTWAEKLACFSAYVDANAASYDIVLFMASYLDAEDAPALLATYEELQARHPSLIFVLPTANLARGIGTAVMAAFNAQLRASAWPRLDIAAVESHDQSGTSWFDNRDGIAYTTPSCSENYPDDGAQYEAIAPHYTRECDGGHLGNPDVGKIRVAKAFWILLAQLAGWVP